MFEKVDVKLDIYFYVTLNTNEFDKRTELREEFLTIARNIFGAVEMFPKSGCINVEGIHDCYKIELNKTVETQEILESIPKIFEEKLKSLRNKVSEKFLVE